MNIEQMKTMIEQRGYRAEEDIQRESNFTVIRIWRGLNLCATADYHEDAEQFADWLDQALGAGQHHMTCSCGLPVLRNDKLFVPRPDDTLQPLYKEYRLASAGPESEPVTTCPQCGTLLREAKEIED